MSDSVQAYALRPSSIFLINAYYQACLLWPNQFAEYSALVPKNVWSFVILLRNQLVFVKSEMSN